MEAASIRLSRAAFVKIVLRKLLTLVAGALIFGWLYNWASPWAFPQNQRAGFGLGILHGAMMPIALPSLVIGNNVHIYAEENSGRPYKIGYICGVNLCGIAFFGPLFWRPRRAAITSANLEKSR